MIRVVLKKMDHAETCGIRQDGRDECICSRPNYTIRNFLNTILYIK